MTSAPALGPGLFENSGYGGAAGGAAPRSVLAGARQRQELRPEDADSEDRYESDSDTDTSTDEEEDELSNFGPEDTILIFDWDDTILPSSWISAAGLNLNDDSIPTEEQQADLERLAGHAIVTLNLAKRYGRVVLVTNAERGWIELSCQKFMPSVYPCLEHLKLTSARTTWEHRGHGGDPVAWKFHAFKREIDDFFADFDPERLKNVISLGDSSHEREALINVTNEMVNCCPKNIKFDERPELEALLREHQLLKRCFRHIVNHRGALDLCLRSC